MRKTGLLFPLFISINNDNTMKKTLFTLACAALAAPAFAGAEITEPITITLPSSATEPTAWKHGNCSNNIDQLITAAGGWEAGFYVGGNNNSYGNPGASGEGTLVTEDNIATVTLCGRSGVGGDSFAMVLGTSQLTGKIVNDLTFSLSGTSANALTLGGTFAVALYNGTTLVDSASSTLANVKTVTDPVSVTLTLPNITFTEAHKIVIAFRGDGGSATTAYKVSNIQLTAAPESATATLSLLALAGLAARRRRH